ncbi:MAG: universal stress protein [Solirubrobacteraceae bacterium]
MGSIVVGVEESERSLDALALARRLAGRGDALLLVCAYPADPLMSGEGGATYGRALRAEAEATLARLGGEIGCETLAVPDRHPAHALAQIGAEVGAAAIVVGSSHTGRLRRILPGSTGEHLLEAAPCAVVVAPRDYRRHAERPIEVVACAYDGAPEALRVLTVAEEIARRHGAALRIVQVIEPSEVVDAVLAVDPQGAAAARRIRERPLDELRRVVGELAPGLDVQADLVSGDPAEELVRASATADLIVAGSRGYGPLHAVLAGAVSGRLIGAAACPVIIVPRAIRLREERGHASATAAISRR